MITERTLAERLRRLAADYMATTKTHKLLLEAAEAIEAKTKEANASLHDALLLTHAMNYLIEHASKESIQQILDAQQYARRQMELTPHQEKKA